MHCNLERKNTHRVNPKPGRSPHDSCPRELAHPSAHAARSFILTCFPQTTPHALQEIQFCAGRPFPREAGPRGAAGVVGAPQPCDLHVPCPVPSHHTAHHSSHCSHPMSRELEARCCPNCTPPGPLFSARHSSATMNATLPEATPGGTRISHSRTESRTRRLTETFTSTQTLTSKWLPGDSERVRVTHPPGKPSVHSLNKFPGTWTAGSDSTYGSGRSAQSSHVSEESSRSLQPYRALGAEVTGLTASHHETQHSG